MLKLAICQFLNFNVVAVEVSVILVCDTVQLGNWAPVTRRDGVTYGKNEDQIHVFIPVCAQFCHNT